MSVLLWAVACWLFGVICFGVLPWFIAPVLPARWRQSIGGWYCSMASKILHRFALVFRDSHEIELHRIRFDQMKRAEKVRLDGEVEHIADDLNALGRLFGHRFGVAHEPSALFTSPLRADLGEAVRQFRTSNGHRRQRVVSPDDSGDDAVALGDGGDVLDIDGLDDAPDAPATTDHEQQVVTEYAAAVPINEASRLVRLRHFQRIVCGDVDAHEAERAKEFGLMSQQGFGDRVSTKQAMFVGGAYMASGLMTWFAMKYGPDTGGGGSVSLPVFGHLAPLVDLATMGVIG